MLAAGCVLLRPAPRTVSAVAELRDAGGRAVGAALLSQVGDVVRIVVTVSGLSPGPKAVHTHEVGACDGPDFASAGRHFDPYGREHGFLNPRGPHAGDLPNITVGEDGRGRLETTNEQVSLLRGPASILAGRGTALVVHAGPDDFHTDPAGGSGARIACGVIVREDGGPRGPPKPPGAARGAPAEPGHPSIP